MRSCFTGRCYSSNLCCSENLFIQQRNSADCHHCTCIKSITSNCNGRATCGWTSQRLNFLYGRMHFSCVSKLTDQYCSICIGDNLNCCGPGVYSVRCFRYQKPGTIIKPGIIIEFYGFCNWFGFNYKSYNCFFSKTITDNQNLRSASWITIIGYYHHLRWVN